MGYRTMLPVDSVAIVYKPAKKCSELMSKYIEVLRSRGFRVETIWVDEVGRGDLDSYDLVIAMGGDGTLLRISWSLTSRSPFILPVPCGRRTVLYEDLDKTEPANIIDRIVKGVFFLELIDRLVTSYSGEKYYALNEIAVITHDFGRALVQDVSIRTPYNTTSFKLEADGLIIATPTGSSAYALSAGGPIVEGNLSNVLVIPLNPVTLNIAPFIVHPFSLIEVCVGDYSDLYMDGIHVATLPPKTTIKARLGNSFLRIIRVNSRRNMVKRLLEGRTTLFKE